MLDEVCFFNFNIEENMRVFVCMGGGGVTKCFSCAPYKTVYKNVQLK